MSEIDIYDCVFVSLNKVYDDELLFFFRRSINRFRLHGLQSMHLLFDGRMPGYTPLGSGKVRLWTKPRLDARVVQVEYGRLNVLVNVTELSKWVKKVQKKINKRDPKNKCRILLPTLCAAEVLHRHPSEEEPSSLSQRKTESTSPQES